MAIAVPIAVLANTFHPAPLSWIRVSRTVDSSAVLKLDTSASLNTAHAQPDTANIPPDTAGAQIDTTRMPIDSTNELAAKQSEDSARTAREAIRRAKDSIDAARLASALAQLPTAKEIDVDVAKLLHDAKAATFIDARPEDHYAEGHIPGAKNVYAEQWQSKIPELLQLPKDKPVVTYCGGGDACELSHELADHLRELNFKVVVVYKGGMLDWKARKYTIATSK